MNSSDPQTLQVLPPTSRKNSSTKDATEDEPNTGHENKEADEKEPDEDEEGDSNEEEDEVGKNQEHRHISAALKTRRLPQDREVSSEEGDQEALSIEHTGLTVHLSSPHHHPHNDVASPYDLNRHLPDIIPSRAHVADVSSITPCGSEYGEVVEPTTEGFVPRAEIKTEGEDPDHSYHPSNGGELIGDVSPNARLKTTLNSDSEVFSDQNTSSNPLSKPSLPEYNESSTVAIAPVFQALPVHIPPSFYATRSHPWNRSGFRYVACGPLAQSKDDIAKQANLPHSVQCPIYYTIETMPEGQVKWAWEDRSSYVYVTKDGLSVTTDRGFRSARANVPIRQGQVYFEVVLERAGGHPNPGPRSESEQAHVRVGLARRESGLNTPVGIDGYSYGIRDKTGEKIHLSKLKPYGDPFGSGDVIGVYVDLPPVREAIPNDPHDPARIERRRIPIRYRRQLYFESPEYPISKEMEDLAEAASPSKLKPKPEFHSTLPPPPAVKKPMPGQKQTIPPLPPPPVVPVGLDARELPVLEGSKLVFFKNGVCQGVAFENLLDFLPLRAHTTSSTSKSKLDPSNANVEDALPDIYNPQTREHLHDDGTTGYYPCVSVFGGGIVRLNPGPDFEYPPPDEIDTSLQQTTRSGPSDVAPFHRNSADKTDVVTPCGRRWKSLSDLYPLHMATQRELDRLDAIEIQRRLAREAKLTEQAERMALKRRRVSSPSSGPVSPTGTTTSSSGGYGNKASKAKKKTKLHITNLVGAASINSPVTQSYKPSPLGAMEICENPLAVIHEADPTDAALALARLAEGSVPHSSLALLSAIATEGISMGSSCVKPVTDSGTTGSLADQPVELQPQHPPSSVTCKIQEEEVQERAVQSDDTPVTLVLDLTISSNPSDLVTEPISVQLPEPDPCQSTTEDADPVEIQTTDPSSLMNLSMDECIHEFKVVIEPVVEPRSDPLPSTS